MRCRGMRDAHDGGLTKKEDREPRKKQKGRRVLVMTHTNRVHMSQNNLGHQPQVFAKFSSLEPNFGSTSIAPPHPNVNPLFLPSSAAVVLEAAKGRPLPGTPSENPSSCSPPPPPLRSRNPCPPAFNPSPASPLLSLTGTSQPPNSHYSHHTVKSSSSSCRPRVQYRPPSPPAAACPLSGPMPATLRGAGRRRRCSTPLTLSPG